jgi:hypothetical protein
MPPRKQRHPVASIVSSRTRALRGSTGLTEAQEEQANALLRKRAHDLHGDTWPSKVTDVERAKLCQQVARAMRQGGVPAATAALVRMVAQRMRCTPEVRTTYPVDLEPDIYAFVAREYVAKGGVITMKAIASAIIRAHVDRLDA